MIPRTTAHRAEPPALRLCWSHLRQMWDLWRVPVLRRTAFGIAFFWGFAGFINLWSIGVAKEITGGGAGFGALSSQLMLAASLGMAAGFGAASVLCRRRIELGWVPVAGIGMTLLTLVLAFLDPGSRGFLAMLGLAAFAAAVFLVPLNAHLQDVVDPTQRGKILAAVNLQDCMAGMVAVALQFGFTAAYQGFGRPEWLGFRGQLVFASVLCGVVTWRVVRRLPADMIRVLGLLFLRWWYRVRPLGAEHVPAQGGVLVLANHLTFADAFVVTALSPRPVRFVMAAEFERNRWVRTFTRLFDTVALEESRPREAIRATTAALAAGDLVCLFPEGQLSRSGFLSGLRRGFELIARHGGRPVVPLYIDGMWGSFFSFSGAGFFTGRPSRLRVIGVFGPPLDPADATPAAVRRALCDASAAALADRLAAGDWEQMPLDEVQCGAADLHRAWANAHQLAATGALPPTAGIHAWLDDDEVTALHGLVRAFPRLALVPIC